MKIEVGNRYRMVNCQVPENNGLIVTVIGAVGVVRYTALDRDAESYRLDRSLLSVCGRVTDIAPDFNLEEIPGKPQLATWGSLAHIWVPSEPVESESTDLSPKRQFS